MDSIKEHYVVWWDLLLWSADVNTIRSDSYSSVPRHLFDCSIYYYITFWLCYTNHSMEILWTDTDDLRGYPSIIFEAVTDGRLYCCSVWTSSVLNVIFRTYQFNQRSTHLFNGTGSLSACMWVEEEGWRAHLKKDEWVEGQMPLCCQCECVCLCGKHLNSQLLLFGRLRAVILLKCSATHSRCNLLTMSAEQHDTRGPRPAETTS